MQYALIEVSERKLLVDAAEVGSMNKFSDAISDADFPADDSIYQRVLAYGDYLPQPDVSEAEAQADLADLKDCWLGTIMENACHPIGLVALISFPAIRRGRSMAVPFAALVCAPEDILNQIGSRNTKRAVTAFLRYSNLSPMTNILNRKGIIAFKGIERRATATEDQWKSAIDEERARRTASVL